MKRSTQGNFYGTDAHRRRLLGLKKGVQMIRQRLLAVLLYGLGCSLLLSCGPPPQPGKAHDPGPRTGSSEVIPIEGLTEPEKALFEAGKEVFEEVEDVGDGLGPTLNLDGCKECHSQPSTGGSSPPTNPQVAFLEKYEDKTNTLPSFITKDGPVREVRFVKMQDGTTPDGGVHDIFTIAGLPEADGCELQQPDFAGEFAKGNVIFRIPTPTFGAGLIEQIPDKAIIDNHEANKKNPYNISGKMNVLNAGHLRVDKENRSGNDGTIARFGWKAQNKSLLEFAGEAYNVEMGISNELFETEREEKAECQFKPTPNDTTNPDKSGLEVLGDTEKFAAFMRFLAPPKPSLDTPGGADSIAHGHELFAEIGCANCHTPTLKTGKSSVVALSEKAVDLYSDLAIHDMGENLTDGVTQGLAGPTEFRSAPLWGLGQRIWFLHDGRTKDLIEAIEQHLTTSGHQSEATLVVTKYNDLPEAHKQDLLNFLRSL